MLESLFNKAVSLTFEEHLQMAACRAKIQKERAKQKKKKKKKKKKKQNKKKLQRNHSFSTFVKFSEKVIFFNP